MGTDSRGGYRDGLEALEVFARSRDGGRLTRRHIGVVVGFFGGIVAASLGAGLSASVWLGSATSASVGFGALRTVLLLSAIPLVVFAAHCLDRLEAALAEDASRASRRARVVSIRRARGGRTDRAWMAAGGSEGTAR
jgi:hypothetical protein